MSVSLLEVLENAGYDVKNNIEDARWLLSQRDDFDNLCEDAEELDDIYINYEEYIFAQEELGNYDNPTFEEWREEIK